MSLDCRLCVVTDRSLAGGRDLLEIVSESLAGGANIIQLREKEISSREFLKTALSVRKLFEDYPDRLFIVNDRLDIALASGAGGVHLGRDDMPVSAARKLAGPDFVIGASVSSAREAVKAASEGASYLGAGAVYPTPTKPESGAVGLDGLREIAGAAGIPVIAIGGVNSGNAFDVIKAGASGAAVVSAVMAAENPREASREILDAVTRAFEIS